MTRTIISPLTLSLLCPLLVLACDPEDIADSDAELPDDIEGEITPRSNQIPVACQSLTPAALQAPVDKMNEAIGLINEYIATTPESNYPTAGTLALGQINQAKSKITNYQAWLTSINHGNPFVYWVGATPFLEVTDSAHLLHGAAWWAYIAVANDEKEVARLSAKRVFEAQQLASEIGKQALLCAIEQYTNCGDGVLDANEACDDGNAVDGDGCSNTCESDGGTCGNSVVDPGEACDDGNEIDNDGCDLCSSRTPWPLQPQNPCEALTPAAIERSVELTDEAIEFIDEYLTPPLVTNYTGAGQYTLDSLNQARSKITAHQTYLASIPHGIPFVSQEAVAAETFTAMKGAADWLRYGMWWGFVATAWDHTPSSRMSARRAADAQKLADHLARQALLCSLAPYALCGDGVVNGTEQCDDGNLIAGDGCSSTCTTESVCGDGVLQGDEECDDGNDIGDDGCEFCELKTSTGLVYARANSLFWQFSETTNAWTARANVPAASNTTLTNDGQFVYSLLMAEAANVPDPNKRNHIFKYDRTQNTWSDHMVGPPYTLDVGGSAGSDLLEWVEDGFVLVNNWYKNENQVITRGVEVWVYQNGAWELKTNIPDVRMFGHGGWDRMSDRIHMTYSHINEASLHGVFTIETGENFATSVHNDPGGMVPKSLPNGSISRGSFFRWEHSGYEMRRYSPTNWSYSGTGKYVSGNVAATDHGDGDIFILSTDTIPNTFSRYSVQSGNLTPLPVPSIGTPVLTVLRPL